MMPLIELGAIVPPSTSLEVEVSTSVQLTDKQRALAVDAKAAFMAAGLITAEWIRRMRDLRNSLEATGANGNGCKAIPKKANNWKQVCADLFQGLDSMHANGMIRGWEALWGDPGDRPQRPVMEGTPNAAEVAENPILRTLSASKTFYRELGKVKEAVRPVLVEKLRSGEMSCTPMAVQKTAKKVEADQKLAGIKSVKPPAPKAAPKPITPKALPISSPKEGNTYSLSKWRKVSQVTEEMEWMQAHLEKMRKAAVSYRNLCKQLEDRLAQGIANNRNRPSEMTVYSVLWKEQDYDFDASLEEVTKELSEANRLWGLAMPLCHGEAQIIE